MEEKQPKAEKNSENKTLRLSTSASFIEIIKKERSFLIIIGVAFFSAGIAYPHAQLAMWVGFVLAGYSAIANDSNAINSPMVGIFYRAASPDSSPFIEVGSSVKKGDTLCIIEAMKLFNEIESEIKGRVVKVLVDDASPVEYDQPLFMVEPA